LKRLFNRKGRKERKKRNRIISRQGAKNAKFGIERLIILTILFIFSDLCGLGVFAGDIPTALNFFCALSFSAANSSNPNLLYLAPGLFRPN